MNDKRRSVLKRALDLLHQVYGYVENVKDGEEDSLDNIPENLQSSEQYEKMETTISRLEDVLDNIESAIENIESASE